MDSAYLQRIRYQLQKRVRRLNSCPPDIFHSSLVQFWNYLLSQDLIAGILHHLDAISKDYSSEIAGLESTYSGPQFSTEAEQRAFNFRVIQHCASQPLNNHMGPEEKLGLVLSHKRDRSECLDHFREMFLEPFYEQLDESLDQQAAVLSLLLKYKRKVEWFSRDDLLAKASEERSLAKHLYAYLFDQGMDFHIEPQSVSGEADLVATDLVLDAKVFDGAKRGLQYLASGVHQVHTYARDFNQEVGYLIVFKNCVEQIDFTFGAKDQSFPFVTVGGKTIYICIVDITEYGASASKRGAMKVYSVSEDFLVREVLDESATASGV